MFRAALSRVSLSSAAALKRQRARRPYSSSKSDEKPTWPLYLSAAGLAGLAYYVYIEWDKNSETKRPPQEKSPLDPKEFIDFKLKKVEKYNHNTSKFVFDLPDQQASLLPVASCVVVKASDSEALLDKNGKPVIRPYTPISPSDQPGDLAFIIKKYDTGNASKHIHSLKEGDTLAIKGPIKKFDFKLNEFSDVALIGGGSGITPLYQIINHALSHNENKTKFKLIYANVEERDILLREEFDAMKRRFPDTFDVVYTLDKVDRSWTGSTGFVNRKLLEKHLVSPDLGDKVKVFICGPPGQVSAIAGKKDGMKQGELGGILKEMGYSSDQVFKF